MEDNLKEEETLSPRELQLLQIDINKKGMRILLK